MIKTNISFKIMAITIASTATVILTSVMTVFIIGGISSSMRSTINIMTAQNTALFNVIGTIDSIGSTVEAMMREKDADALESLNTNLLDFEQNSATLVEDFGTDGVELKKIYSSFETGINTVVELVLLGDNASARQSYIEKVAPFKTALVDEIFKLQLVKGTRMNEEVNGRLKAASSSSMLLTFVLIVFSILIGSAGFLVTKNIIGSVNRVVLRLKEISEGDGDLTARIESRGNDEIADLTGYFNAFTEKLSAMIRVVQVSLGNLTGTSHDLVANTEQTAAAVNEISANVESFKTRSETQGRAIDETAVSMESLNRGLGSLDGMIEDQGGSVEQSSAAVEQMVANVGSVSGNVSNLVSLFKELMGTADVGKSRIGAVAALAEGIAEQSDALAETNKLIAAIAAQTNLLAMNAAIEAAHAGDAGRGFSVVADEIRKLAENSASQSKATSSVLKGVRNQISEVVKSSGDAEKTFETILSMIERVGHLADEVKAAMNEQGKGNAQVLEAIRKITDISIAVKARSAEMRGESDAALGKIAGVRRLSDEFRAGMDEIAIGTEEINKAIIEIRGLGQDNKESIEGANGASSKFKV